MVLAPTVEPSFIFLLCFRLLISQRRRSNWTRVELGHFCFFVVIVIILDIFGCTSGPVRCQYLPRAIWVLLPVWEQIGQVRIHSLHLRQLFRQRRFISFLGHLYFFNVWLRDFVDFLDDLVFEHSQGIQVIQPMLLAEGSRQSFGIIALVNHDIVLLWVRLAYVHFNDEQRLLIENGLLQFRRGCARWYSI